MLGEWRGLMRKKKEDGKCYEFATEKVRICDFAILNHPTSHLIPKGALRQTV